MDFQHTGQIPIGRDIVVQVAMLQFVVDPEDRRLKTRLEHILSRHPHQFSATAKQLRIRTIGFLTSCEFVPSDVFETDE
jgi:hypothetical protein